MKPISIFRKRIGFFLVACIGFYLAVSAYLTFFPKATFITPKITQYYQWFALPGPFFREDRIVYIPHLTFRYKEKNGSWSDVRNIERENFYKYHEHYFDYPDLKRSRYERFLGRTLSQKMKKKSAGRPEQFRELKELHAYLKKNYLPAETDSVELDYTWKDVRNDSTSQGFHLVYKSF